MEDVLFAGRYTEGSREYSAWGGGGPLSTFHSLPSLCKNVRLLIPRHHQTAWLGILLLCPWMSHFPALGLSFPICKMGTIAVSISLGCRKE